MKLALPRWRATLVLSVLALLAVCCVPSRAASRLGREAVIISPTSKAADPDNYVENDATEGTGRPYEKKDLDRNTGDDRDYRRFEGDLMHDESQDSSHLPLDEVGGRHADAAREDAARREEKDSRSEGGNTGVHNKAVSVQLNNQNRLENPMGWAAQYTRVTHPPSILPPGLSDEPSSAESSQAATPAPAAPSKQQASNKGDREQPSNGKQEQEQPDQDDKSADKDTSGSSSAPQKNGGVIKGMCVLSPRKCPSGFKNEGVAALRVGLEFRKSSPFPMVASVRDQVKDLNSQLKQDDAQFRFVTPVICCATSDAAELGHDTYVLGTSCPDGTSEVLSGVVWDKKEYESNPFNKDMEQEPFDDKHVWIHPYVCRVDNVDAFLTSRSRVCMMAGQCSDSTRTFGHAGILVDKKTVKERKDVEYVFKVAHARRLPPLGDFVWVRPKLCCSSRKLAAKNAQSQGAEQGAQEQNQNEAGAVQPQEEQQQQQDQQEQQPQQEGEEGEGEDGEKKKKKKKKNKKRKNKKKHGDDNADGAAQPQTDGVPATGNDAHHQQQGNQQQDQAGPDQQQDNHANIAVGEPHPQGEEHKEDGEHHDEGDHQQKQEEEHAEAGPKGEETAGAGISEQ